MIMRSSFLPSTICLNDATGILTRNQNPGERYAVGRGRRTMMMSMSSRSSNSPCPSPWLMLPPTFDKSRGGMLYNLYSPADDKVFLLSKYGAGVEPIVCPDDDALVVGSSQGWLALMNRRNNDLFLSDPISRRHIKLPPVDGLPQPELNLRRGDRARVSRVIVSASPDDEECRAVMSFGPGDRLAFCRPGRSEEWIPIGELTEEEDGGYLNARVYNDFVYSSGSNLLTCLISCGSYDEATLEEWDLGSSEVGWIQTEILPAVFHSGYLKPEIEFGEDCLRRDHRVSKHLVYAERSDEVLMLFRYMNGAGATVGFIVGRVEMNGGKVRLVRSCLEGLAVFVGSNHSFAVSAAEFPRLKPNSIYFSFTAYRERLDVGVFDCRHATFSSSYYPLHTQTTTIPPIWFTPARS